MNEMGTGGQQEAMKDPHQYQDQTSPLAIQTPAPCKTPNNHHNISPCTVDLDSTLIRTSHRNQMITSPNQLYIFLDRQAIHQTPTEQGCFNEDALNFMGLLVLTVIQQHSSCIHLVHSVQVYQNAPGNNIQHRMGK